jgi:hypothetical protein
MRDLPNLQAVVYSHVYQESAIQKIAEALSGEKPPPPPPPPQPGGGGELHLHLLRDPSLPRSAFLFGTDGVITEVPLDQGMVQFTDNINIPIAEIKTIEVVSAQVSDRARVRVTRNDDAQHEGDLAGEMRNRRGERCLGCGVSMSFGKLRRIEFGSLHSNGQRFEHVASWGKSEIRRIAFSPDGTLLAAASPGGPLLS